MRRMDLNGARSAHGIQAIVDLPEFDRGLVQGFCLLAVKNRIDVKTVSECSAICAIVNVENNVIAETHRYLRMAYDMMNAGLYGTPGPLGSPTFRTLVELFYTYVYSSELESTDVWMKFANTVDRAFKQVQISAEEYQTIVQLLEQYCSEIEAAHLTQNLHVAAGSVERADVWRKWERIKWGSEGYCSFVDAILFDAMTGLPYSPAFISNLRSQSVVDAAACLITPEEFDQLQKNLTILQMRGSFEACDWHIQS